jgi:flagellar hook-length control protein FliK
MTGAERAQQAGGTAATAMAQRHRTSSDRADLSFLDLLESTDPARSGTEPARPPKTAPASRPIAAARPTAPEPAEPNREGNAASDAATAGQPAAPVAGVAAAGSAPGAAAGGATSAGAVPGTAAAPAAAASSGTVAAPPGATPAAGAGSETVPTVAMPGAGAAPAAGAGPGAAAAGTGAATGTPGANAAAPGAMPAADTPSQAPGGDSAAGAASVDAAQTSRAPKPDTGSLSQGPRSATSATATSSGPDDAQPTLAARGSDPTIPAPGERIAGAPGPAPAAEDAAPGSIGRPGGSAAGAQPAATAHQVPTGAEREAAAKLDAAILEGRAAAAETGNAAHPAEAGTRSPGRAAPLHRTVESVELALRITAQRGASQARLSLRPAELGQVEVTLRATADGLVARVTADAAQAANLLQQAEQDLRRSLEAAGVRLLQLDIVWNGGPGGEAARDARTGGGGRPAREGGGTETEPLDRNTTTTVVELPGGVLVDVIA